MSADLKRAKTDDTSPYRGLCQRQSYSFFTPSHAKTSLWKQFQKILSTEITIRQTLRSQAPGHTYVEELNLTPDESGFRYK